MANRYTVESIFKAIDRVSAPVRKIQQNVERATSGMQSHASRIGDSVGRNLRVMALAGTMAGHTISNALEQTGDLAERVNDGLGKVADAALAAGAAIGVIAASVISTGSDFEKTLMSAVARFPGHIQRGTEAFEALGAAAERVGATTEFDAQQAAGALNVYAAAGFSAQGAIASLAGAGDLATVSGLTLDEAAKTAADSLGALAMRSSDAAVQAANLTRVNDIFARTTSLANTSVTEVSEAVAAGGNIAVRSGQSIETFGAAVAAMAASNIKGAEAGTAIRNVLLRLQAPAARGQRALDRLGVSVKNGDGSMRDMVDVLGDLSTATAGMGDAARNQALATIFGAETITPALALLGAGRDGLLELRGALEGSAGAAAEMAGTMRDTTTGDIDGFTSAIDGVKTAIFGLVSGPFRALLGKMTEWTNANRAAIASGIGGFVQGLATNFDKVVQRGAGLLFVAAGIKAIATATMLWAQRQALVNAVTKANPYVMLAMAIIAAIGLIIAFWPEISAWFSSLWDDIKWLGREIGRLFTSAWNSVVDGASSMWTAVSGFFSRLWSGLVAGVSSIASAIAGFFVRMWNGIVSVAVSVGAAIAGAFEAVWSRIQSFFTGVLEFVVGLFVILGTEAMTYLQPLIDAVMVVVDAIQEKFTAVVDTVAAIWGGVTLVVSMLWQQVRDRVMAVVDSIVAKFTAAWVMISTALSIVGAAIRIMFDAVWNAVATKVGEVVGRVRNYWFALQLAASSVGGSIRDAFASAWNSVVAKATEVYEVVKGIWSGIVGFFTGLWDGIYNAFVSVFSRIGEFLSGIVGSIGAVVQAVQTIGRGAMGDDEESGGADGSRPQVVSPQDRTARVISESTSTTQSEVTIRDQTGRAEITRNPRNGPTLRLQPSGSP